MFNLEIIFNSSYHSLGKFSENPREIIENCKITFKSNYLIVSSVYDGYIINKVFDLKHINQYKITKI